jgi:hypothetical protein
MYEQTIADTLSRLRVGGPMSDGPLCIVPVRCASDVPDRYVLLSQALRRGTVLITEVSEAGEVPYLSVFNKGPWPVLVFDGEELVGAKQNRIANATTLLAVGKTVLPVSCVEQGRWHAESRVFRAGSYASHPGLRRDKERRVRERVAWEARRRETTPQESGRHGAPQERQEAATAGGRAEREESQHVRARRYMADQGMVWEEVHRVSNVRGAVSPTAAMADTYQSEKHELDRIIDVFRPGMRAQAADAVGMMVFVGGEFVCFDLLQPARRFSRLVRKLLRGYALEALLHSLSASLPFDAEEAALRVFAELGHATVNARAAAGLGDDLRLETGRISGSGLVWQGELIQLSLFPKAE